jgi:hypothetical protein
VVGRRDSFIMRYGGATEREPEWVGGWIKRELKKKKESEKGKN